MIAFVKLCNDHWRKAAWINEEMLKLPIYTLLLIALSGIEAILSFAVFDEDHVLFDKRMALFKRRLPAYIKRHAGLWVIGSRVWEALLSRPKWS